MRRLGALIMGCGLLVGCAEQPERPTPAQETAYQQQLPPRDEPVEYFLFTHCGVRPISLGGEWWHPVAPVDDAGADLGDYERGRLVVTSESRAVFESDDIRVEFERGATPTTFCR